LFLVHGVNWVVAWFVYTSVKSICIEELALVLSGIGVISSKKDSIGFLSAESTSRNDVVNARVVIS